jgi:hypothetical protein
MPMTPISPAEIIAMLNSLVHMDKETMISLGYATYLYIMMDRSGASSRRHYRR